MSDRYGSGLTYYQRLLTQLYADALNPGRAKVWEFMLASAPDWYHEARPLFSEAHYAAVRRV